MKIRSRLEFFLAKIAGRNIDVNTLIPAGATNMTEKLMLEISDRLDNCGEPDTYIKAASVEGDILTLTNKDDTTIEFARGGGGGGADYSAGTGIGIEDGEIRCTYGEETGTVPSPDAKVCEMNRLDELSFDDGVPAAIGYRTVRAYGVIPSKKTKLYAWIDDENVFVGEAEPFQVEDGVYAYLYNTNTSLIQIFSGDEPVVVDERFPVILMANMDEGDVFFYTTSSTAFTDHGITKLSAFQEQPDKKVYKKLPDEAINTPIKMIGFAMKEVEVKQGEYEYVLTDDYSADEVAGSIFEAVGKGFDPLLCVKLYDYDTHDDVYEYRGDYYLRMTSFATDGGVIKTCGFEVSSGTEDHLIFSAYQTGDQFGISMNESYYYK